MMTGRDLVRVAAFLLLMLTPFLIAMMIVVRGSS